MSSKKLGALLRSAPPVTVAAQTEDPSSPAVAAPVPEEPQLPPSPPALRSEHEVPLQVLIPAHVRRRLGVMAAEEGESLRTLVLRAIRSLGIAVTDEEIKGKRGRRNS